MAMSSVSQEDWQMSRTLAECNKHMLEHQLQCDVTFRVGAKSATDDIKAHKYVLISRSPVFYTMFCGSLPQSDTTVIELPDVDPQAFREMLKYLYYEEENLNIAEYGLLIMYCAKKYMIPKLGEVCSTFLQCDVTMENVAPILEQSMNMDEVELKKRCLEFVGNNADKVFKLGSHVGLSREAWKLVVQSDELMVNENDVYNACIEWGKARCKERNINEDPHNVREVLGNIVCDVRMPLMTQEEFVTCIEKCDILSHDELRNMFSYFTKRDSKLMPFCMNQRKINQRKINQKKIPFSEYSRFAKTATGWVVGKNHNDILDVSCSTDVVVHGILVYGGSTNMDTHSVTATIHDAAQNMIGKGNARITSDGTDKLHRVMIATPCRLSKDATYTLSVAMDGSARTYRGESGRSSIPYYGGTINFKSSIISRNQDTNDRRGQIPGLLLSNI